MAKDDEMSEWRLDKKLKALKATGVVAEEKVTLLLPETFMNKSGQSVAPLISGPKKAAGLVVVQDDIDLPIGTFKICFNRGSGGHKGIESIMRAIKTKEFVRVRVGVSPETTGGKLKKPQGEDGVVDFIVGKFKPAEMELLKKISKKVVEALYCIVEEGREKAMNQYN